MGRPIAADAANAMVPNSARSQIPPQWMPRAMYFKLQSALSLHIGLFRAAFPSTPWAFVHRQPVEVLASLFRNARNPPAPKSGKGVTINPSDVGIMQAPCMRSYRSPVASQSAFVTALLGLHETPKDNAYKAPGALGAMPESFCAASVAELTASAVSHASAARHDALLALARGGLLQGVAEDAVEATDPLNGAAIAAVVTSGYGDAGAGMAAGSFAHAGSPVHMRGNVDVGFALVNATTGRGALAGIGQAFMLPYDPDAPEEVGEGSASASSPSEGRSLVEAVVEMVTAHMRPPQLPGGRGKFGLPKEAYIALREVARRYSKARTGGAAPSASRGGAGARKDSSARAMDGAGNFVGDAFTKQWRAWPALRVASKRYLSSLHHTALAFNAGVKRSPPADDADSEASALAGSGGGSAPTSNRQGQGSGGDGGSACAPFDVRMLPIGGGYPATYPLGEILSDWNPDVTTLPAHYGRYSSMRTFDYADEQERTEAEHYRRAEVPFVIRNVPELAPTVEKWASDDYLLSQAKAGGNDDRFPVEVNDDNTHFMYYRRGPATSMRGGRFGRGAGAATTGSGGGRSKAAGGGSAAAPVGSLGWTPPTREGHISLREWFRVAHTVEKQVAAEEGANGALPRQWAARSHYQRPGSGLSSLDRNATLARLPCNAAWLERNARVRLPADVAAGGRSENVWPHGRTLEELVSGNPQRGGADVVPGASKPLQRAKKTLYYLRASTGARGMTDYGWIGKDVPIFNGAAGPSFFVVVPSEQRGVHCRMGQPGIIAEAHFDAGRNFIAMIRGRKRYILSPPTACPHLEILRDGPSARHSSADWTSQEGIAKIASARGLEVVLEPGDVLYVPAFWFHFIVSLSTNIQCNSRSGTPPHGIEGPQACGMNPRITEELGEYTAALPPAHHLLALATGGLHFPSLEAVPARRLVALADAVHMVRGEAAAAVSGGDSGRHISGGATDASGRGSASSATVVGGGVHSIRSASSLYASPPYVVVASCTALFVAAALGRVMWRMRGALLGSWGLGPGGSRAPKLGRG